MPVRGEIIREIEQAFRNEKNAFGHFNSQWSGRTCPKKFELYKQRLCEDDLSQLSLECCFGLKTVKSDLVATTDFVGQQFRFRFRKRSLKEDNPVTVFLRYHKGNSDVELGYFALSA